VTVVLVDPDVFLWLVARAAGVAAYVSLCLSMLSGLALRTPALEFLAEKKPVRLLHDFTVWIWLPLGIAHVGALVLDRTARIGLLDLVVPFRAPYGQLAIGLGTVSLDLVLLVVVTSWLRKRMDVRTWRLFHYTSYVAFAAMFAHAILSGTDFAAPLIAWLGWLAAAAVGALVLQRVNAVSRSA
jgi:sulfoxide reductase heme-binding subunit YedZ